ncbi:Fis family transcriptional regulator [Kocuria sp. SM24M-10]|uniref:Fis family transcriptional regulator n=1 Tax=Kocuria sp. SM24M-10 TaxID=1660349 RepID=UPI0006497619|nr:Fis family transcriptional regulator [Kocuria sp. SM24M-10]KLU08416.1 Fis family transcriptional regulator [Kocuria sp. SM24M-10]
MSRPRPPSDPETWPTPCTRCRDHHEIAATWPDGPVCRYCYQQAKRTTGTCACGHTGILPGRLDGRPACRTCTGITLNLDCRTCRTEAELHSGGQCWSCVLAATVDRLLTNPHTQQMHPGLAPVATALKAMDRPNSGLTWLHQPHVTAFLTDLATTATINHETLDALPPSRTRDYVRALLVAHGALPPRDEQLARFTAWNRDAIQRLPAGEHREARRRFIRWHQTRRMTTTDGETTQGTFLTAKQTTTVAIDFLTWLTNRGTTLSELAQADLDDWQAGGPTTRERADRFLRWAATAQLVDPRLRLQPHRHGTAAHMSHTDQTRALARVVDHEELSPRDRLAAILVLVLAQQIEDVVGLTWDQVTINDDRVTITVGAHPVELPPPLDEPLRHLVAEPGHDRTAAHPHSRWIFRGNSPGQHLDASHLRRRLKTVCAPRAARLGTLEELTKLSPIPVLAEILGYHPNTIERHATHAASTYARYIAARQ